MWPTGPSLWLGVNVYIYYMYIIICYTCVCVTCVLAALINL